MSEKTYAASVERVRHAPCGSLLCQACDRPDDGCQIWQAAEDGTGEPGNEYPWSSAEIKEQHATRREVSLRKRRDARMSTRVSPCARERGQEEISPWHAQGGTHKNIRARERQARYLMIRQAQKEEREEDEAPPPSPPSPGRVCSVIQRMDNHEAALLQKATSTYAEAKADKKENRIQVILPDTYRARETRPMHEVGVDMMGIACSRPIQETVGTAADGQLEELKEVDMGAPPPSMTTSRWGM